jgi:hypothetical protein
MKKDLPPRHSPRGALQRTRVSAAVNSTNEVANSGGLFLLVLILILGLGLLLLPRLLRHRGLDNFLLPFLLFREPQPALRYVENDGAVPFKGDFAREV